MPLTKPSVSGLDLERTSLALWQEFLSSFFDGAAHDVGRDAGVRFPRADIVFQEHPLPLQVRVGITVVFVAATRVKRSWEYAAAAAGAAGVAGGEGGESEGGEAHELLASEATARERQERATSDLSWMFFVRAGTQPDVREASDRLYGLLENSLATAPLSQKGIHKLRPMPPRLVHPGDGSPSPDPSYRVRLVTCRATVRWVIRSQPAVI